MLFTYRGVVDDEGVIRLLDLVKLKEGTHVLVTLADTDTLIALLKSPVPNQAAECDFLSPRGASPRRAGRGCSVGLSVERSVVVVARFPFSDRKCSTACSTRQLIS